MLGTCSRAAPPLCAYLSAYTEHNAEWWIEGRTLANWLGYFARCGPVGESIDGLGELVSWLFDSSMRLSMSLLIAMAFTARITCREHDCPLGARRMPSILLRSKVSLHGHCQHLHISFLIWSWIYLLGWDYYLQPPTVKKVPPKNYSENFLYKPNKLRILRTK